MHRALVVGLITSLIFVGALHYAPLWLFVIAVPIWLTWWLVEEELRIHNRAILQIQERLKSRIKEDR